MAQAVVSDVTEPEIAEALARAGLYRLLGGAFAYPAADRFPELAHAARLAAAAPLHQARRPLLERLAETAREVEPALIAEEYAFLFDRTVRCAPYEGAYLVSRELSGKPARLADIAGFYAAFGVVPAAAQPDLEDHVAAECEFMSVLALKEAYALAEGETEGHEVSRRAQVAFLGDHLGRWAGAFAEAVRAASPTPFYAAAAALLEAWIEAEIAALGVDVGPPAEPPLDGPLEADVFSCPMSE